MLAHTSADAIVQPVAASPTAPLRAPRQPTGPWPLPGRIGFRWLFTYFVLYQIPFPLSALPVLGVTEVWWTKLWNAPLPWIGRTLFGIDTVRTGVSTGSGDQLADYLRSFLFAVVATIVAGLWTVLRDAPEHRRLARWWTSYTRYALAATLIVYGVAKVVPQQMPAPSIMRLTEQYGDLSPMGLVWAFIGTSAPYEMFSGVAELVPGVLLIFRRTALLGALLAVPVMTNVVLLNFAYDVPVKLYSSHLLAMALIVIAPHAGRLLDFVVLNRTPMPADDSPLVESVWGRRMRAGMKAGLLIFAAFQLYSAAARKRQSGPSDPIAGAWTAASHSALLTREGSGVSTNSRGAPASGGVESLSPPLPLRPPLAAASPWHALTIVGPIAAIRLANDDYLNVRMKTSGDSITFTPYDSMNVEDTTRAIHARFETRGTDGPLRAAARPGDTLIIETRIAGTPTTMVFVRRDLSKQRLTTRGFRWVQEYPYNR